MRPMKWLIKSPLTDALIFNCKKFALSTSSPEEMRFLVGFVFLNQLFCSAGMMLVRRDSWLLGGQLPLRFVLRYSLLPTLSLIFLPVLPVLPRPCGHGCIQPRAGDRPSTLRPAITAGSLFRERGFQGGKPSSDVCGCTPCTGLRAPSEADVAGTSIWCSLPSPQCPQLSTLRRDEGGFATGGTGSLVGLVFLCLWNQLMA